MLNCLNILQPSSGSEHICAMYCVLYTNIHMYIINVFSTYVFPNAFQTQLLLRHLFLLLRSCSDRKLLESDENKPLSLLEPGGWAEPAPHWVMSMSQQHNQLPTSRGPNQHNSNPETSSVSLNLREKHSVHPLKCQFGTPILPPQECGMLWNHSYTTL